MLLLSGGATLLPVRPREVVVDWELAEVVLHGLLQVVLHVMLLEALLPLSSASAHRSVTKVYAAYR